MLYDINLPELKEIHSEGNSSTFEVEPLYPGYGMTLGNAMRRVLLSSLAGSAITGVKIEGVSHEFSAVPGVREDVIEIILNLKQVRFANNHQEAVTVTLKKTGKGDVLAGDIKTVSGVEVANPELVIASLDNSKSKIEMELHIEQGRGYVAVESGASERLPVGMIAIDAIYTPVKRVRYSVENTRVGQMTDLDKLILEVETDGTVSASDAVSQSAEILVGHFQVLAGHDVVSVGSGGIVTAAEKQEADMAQISIDEVNFSPRTTNALMNNDIKTIKEIMELKPTELKELKGFGQKAYEEVLEKLDELGVNSAGSEGEEE
ncbi:MAG: DNA-directed RNA polymerase subunit alpha [Candidatus Saccharibacteria bacterium]|nr:DNA-directed RNA polymerase subunit alpha [Patescibacteria group bacterium]